MDALGKVLHIHIQVYIRCILEYVVYFSFELVNEL